MPNSLRVFTRAKVRTLPTYNEGTFEGRPWSNWTLEIVDEDDNKVNVRVPSQQFGEGLVIGEWYDFMLDVSATGKARLEARSFSTIDVAV